MAKPKLTDAERQAAADAAMSPERYAALRDVRTYDQWAALNARERDDAEHERLKTAVREALDERERR